MKTTCDSALVLFNTGSASILQHARVLVEEVALEQEQYSFAVDKRDRTLSKHPRGEGLGSSGLHTCEGKSLTPPNPRTVNHVYGGNANPLYLYTPV